MISDADLRKKARAYFDTTMESTIAEHHDSLASLLIAVRNETIEAAAKEIEDERSKYMVRSTDYYVAGQCLDRIRGLASTKPEGGK